LVDFAISFAILGLLMIWYHVLPTLSLLMVPPLVLATIFTAFGVGTILSALAATYRDFRYVIPFMVQMWMFVSPRGLSVRRDSRALAVGLLAEPHGRPDQRLPFRPSWGEPFRWGRDGACRPRWLVALLAASVFYFRRVERRFRRWLFSRC